MKTIFEYAPDGLFEGKNIALFVTGSIAAYKALELLRLLTGSGAKVRVVMSERSKAFVGELSFEALSGHTVLSQNTETWTNSNNHIAIGKWADVGIIAPCTANTINAIANGLADGVLLSSVLAFGKPIVVAMAANTTMYKHHITQSSMKLLGLSAFHFVQPASKTLVCGDTGEGAMASVYEVYWATARLLHQDDFYTHRKAIVTAGGTVECIDDVRFLSNFSSGKMGHYLAMALYAKGADVCLITTKDAQNDLIHTIEVKSASEMLTYLQESIQVSKRPKIIKPSLSNDLTEPLSVQKTPMLFMAAAVSDYVPCYPQKGKLKKDILGEVYDLKLMQNPDLLQSIDKQDLYAVGFKAELDVAVALQNAQAMKAAKGLDAVVLNVLEGQESFGSEDNSVRIIGAGDEECVVDKAHKFEVSWQLLEWLKQKANI